jgi:phosphate transport system protein
MEIAYGYSRFGRYAYDISQVFGIFGDLSDCDKVVIEKAGRKAVEMVHLSNKAFTERNGEVAKQVKDMDDDIDRTYLDFVTKAAKSKADNLACVLSGVLILRYLERIADHATYVGDSVLYIISGTRASKQ